VAEDLAERIAGDDGVPGREPAELVDNAATVGRVVVQRERAAVVNAAAEIALVAADGRAVERERATVVNAAAFGVLIGDVAADGRAVERERAPVVRRAKASIFSGCNSHPATFAPAGSNWSGDGGNEIAEASDGKDRRGRFCEQAGRNASERRA